jgi:hypothetical protein
MPSALRAQADVHVARLTSSGARLGDDRNCIVATGRKCPLGQKRTQLREVLRICVARIASLVSYIDVRKAELGKSVLNDVHSTNGRAGSKASGPDDLSFPFSDLVVADAMAVAMMIAPIASPMAVAVISPVYHLNLATRLKPYPVKN